MAQAFGALVGVAVLSCAAPLAAAEPEPMVAHLRDYFHGELDEAAAWLGVGAGAAYLGGALIANGRDEARAASVPVLTFGAVEIGAGIVLLARTGRQIRELSALARRDLGAYRAVELPRMERVNGWFDVYLSIECIAIAAGGGTALYGAIARTHGFGRGADRAFGAGLGLAAQGVAMLTFDLTAAARAREYTRWIRHLTVAPATADGPGIRVLGAF